MLTLSKKTDYGLMALNYLGACEAREAVNAKKIAKKFKIPEEFLAKILQKLAKRGLVISHSGPNGGYRLARAADEITVAEVIDAIEGPVATVWCQTKKGLCTQESCCTLKKPMEKVNHRVLNLLSQLTLVDVNN